MLEYIKKLVQQFKNKWSSLTKKRRIFYRVIFCLLFVILLTPVLVKAGVLTAVASIVTSGLSLLIDFVGGFILPRLISILVKIAQYSGFTKVTAVKAGWVIVRDLCNMFFIVILLIIAFATILRLESYGYKKWLGKLVIAAIVVNFSKTITGFFIDISQVVMLTFVSAFQDAVVGNFAKGLQLTKLLSASKEAAHTEVKSGDISDIAGAASLVGAFLLAVILLVVSVIVILIMIVVLLGRIVSLWVLTILSPIAYLLQASPFGAKYARQWWQEFGKNLVSGPVLAFFLWLAFYTIQESDKMIELQVEDKVKLEERMKGTAKVEPEYITGVSTSESLLNFMVTIALLLAAIKITQQMGVIGSSFAGKMQQNMGKWGKKALKGTASYIDRKQALLSGVSGKLMYENIKEGFARRKADEYKRIQGKADIMATKGGAPAVLHAVTAGYEGAQAMFKGFLNVKGFAKMADTAFHKRGFFSEKQNKFKGAEENQKALEERKHRIEIAVTFDDSKDKNEKISKAANEWYNYEKEKKTKEEELRTQEIKVGDGTGTSKEDKEDLKQLEKLQKEYDEVSAKEEEAGSKLDNMLSYSMVKDMSNPENIKSFSFSSAEIEKRFKEKKEEEKKAFSKEKTNKAIDKEQRIEIAKLRQSTKYEKASETKKKEMEEEVKEDVREKHKIKRDRALAEIADKYSFVKDGKAVAKFDKLDGSGQQRITFEQALENQKEFEHEQLAKQEKAKKRKDRMSSKEYEKKEREIEENNEYKNGEDRQEYIKGTKKIINKIIDEDERSGHISHKEADEKRIKIAGDYEKKLIEAEEVLTGKGNEAEEKRIEKERNKQKKIAKNVHKNVKDELGKIEVNLEGVNIISKGGIKSSDDISGALEKLKNTMKDLKKKNAESIDIIKSSTDEKVIKREESKINANNGIIKNFEETSDEIKRLDSQRKYADKSISDADKQYKKERDASREQKAKEIRASGINQLIGGLEDKKQKISQDIYKHAVPKSLSARSAARSLVDERKKEIMGIDDNGELNAYLKSAIKSKDGYKAIAIMEKMTADGNDNEFLNAFGYESTAIGLDKFRREILMGKGSPEQVAKFGTLRMSEQESLRVQNDISYLNEKIGHWETARTVSTRSNGMLESKIKQRPDGTYDDTDHALEAFAEVTKRNSREILRGLNRLAYGGEKVRADGSGRDFQFSNLGRMLVTMLNNDSGLMAKRSDELNINAAQHFMNPIAMKELGNIIGDTSIFYKAAYNISGAHTGTRSDYEMISKLLKERGVWK